MTALQQKHISSLDVVLGKEISGSWYLRNELQDNFMTHDEVSHLLRRADHLYEKGKIQNNGKPYSPKYRFHRLVDADTVCPKIAFQLIIPGSHVRSADVIGEILLDVLLGEHGSVRFRIPEESPAVMLARENNWKASEEELQALDALIVAARNLGKFGHRNFPVTVDVDKDGVRVSAKYADPMAPVRLALVG